MSVISKEYILRRVRSYLQTDEGRKYVEKKAKIKLSDTRGGGGSISRRKVKPIADEIMEKFTVAVSQVIQSFRREGVFTSTRADPAGGYVNAKISVDEDALRRASLHRMNKDMTISHGEGVEDILALFAHGYTISGRRPYGFWVRSDATGEPMTRIGALTHRDPNPFLTDFVNKMNAEYSGTCEVTLNDKYK